MARALKFQHVDDINTLRSAIPELRGIMELAVDCEGVDLSKTGKLCLIQVGTKEKVFCFDVIALGRRVFDEGKLPQYHVLRHVHVPRFIA
mgnify:CR=1 FL=1